MDASAKAALSPTTLFSSKTALPAGLAAGLVVGLGSGIVSAAAAHLPLGSWPATLGLAVGLQGLLGLLMGGVAAALAAVVRWGHAAPASPTARRFAWILSGLLCAAAAGQGVWLTAGRNNRFLAAGVVVGLSLVAGLVGALLLPAAIRLLSRKRAEPLAPSRWPTAAGLVLLVPLVTLVIEAIVFVAVWRARAPLRPALRWERALAAGAASALLPAAWGLVSSRLAGWSRRRALVVAGVSFLLPASALVALRWNLDFRFLPWTDIVTVAAIVVLAALLLPRLRTSFRSRVGLAAGAIPALACLVFLAAASEAARKATSAHAGLIGPVLTQLRTALDADKDGFPRLLGGGDCADDDPEINPGAIDIPGDGRDQDCDGEDAAISTLAPTEFFPIPPTVGPNVNVLFVTIDTLRADRLGAYGYKRPTSPNIDRVAAEGVVFENGWAHAPSTRFSMPTIATGRWPSTVALEDCSGCDSWWHRLAPGQTTIAEAFKGLGYATGAFYAYQYFLRSNLRGYERGIDVYQDRCAELHRNVEGPAESHGSSSREMADDVISFLEARGREKFFAWVHFYDPHLQYEKHPDAPPFGDSQSDLYDGEVWFTDHHLGRILDTLRRLGVYDRTIVVLTGDHGEGLGERGIVAHGYDLFAAQTKIPYIIRVPGIAPRRVPDPVGHVDLAPTLVNLVGGTRPKTFLGRSLVDVLAGQPQGQAPPRFVYQEVNYEGPTDKRGLVSASHHLVWNKQPDNSTLCFDVRTDPREERDLWGTGAGEPACTELRRELGRFIARLSLPEGFQEKFSFGVIPAGTPLPAPNHPGAAQFGAFVRYLGTDVSQVDIATDANVEVTVIPQLEILQAPGKTWRMFVHLERPGGFENLDHVPVEGTYPVDRWQKGQQIRDRIHVPFRPGTRAPGEYRIYLGFWRPGSSERMPISPANMADGGDRIRIATLRVLPPDASPATPPSP